MTRWRFGEKSCIRSGNLVFHVNLTRPALCVGWCQFFPLRFGLTNCVRFKWDLDWFGIDSESRMGIIWCKKKKKKVFSYEWVYYTYFYNKGEIVGFFAIFVLKKGLIYFFSHWFRAGVYRVRVGLTSNRSNYRVQHLQKKIKTEYSK